MSSTAPDRFGRSYDDDSALSGRSWQPADGHIPSVSWCDDAPASVPQPRRRKTQVFPDLDLASNPRRRPRSVRVMTVMSIGIALTAITVVILLVVRNGVSLNVSRRTAGKAVVVGVMVAVLMITAIARGLAGLLKSSRRKREITDPGLS